MPFGTNSETRCYWDTQKLIAMNALDQHDNPSRSITEFLKAARWKHALLTTYALSLSYFESEVLRVLLQQGCDDIWLVCDAQGYVDAGAAA